MTAIETNVSKNELIATAGVLVAARRAGLDLNTAVDVDGALVSQYIDGAGFRIDIERFDGDATLTSVYLNFGYVVQKVIQR